MPRFKLHPLLLLASAILLPFAVSVFATLGLVLCLQAFGLVWLCLYRHPGRAAKMLAVFAGVFALYQAMLGLAHIRALAFVGMFAFMLLRVLPAMALVSLLLYDVETGEMVAALNQIHLPKNLVLGFTALLRFLPTVQMEMRTMRQALIMRRVRLSWARPVQAMEYFMVPVLYRTQILAEELAATAVTKGAQSPAKRTSLYGLRWHWADTMFTLALIVIFAASIGMGGGA